MSKYQNPRQKPAKRQPDRFDIEAGARCLYIEEGGSTLELNIKTQERTLRAYNSQVDAFERCARNGVAFDGDIPPGAWGPLVSPREARMAGSLIARLLREQEAWINRCREKIEADIKENNEREAAAAAEAEAEQIAAEEISVEEVETTIVVGEANESPDYAEVTRDPVGTAIEETEFQRDPPEQIQTPA